MPRLFGINAAASAFILATLCSCAKQVPPVVIGQATSLANHSPTKSKIKVNDDDVRKIQMGQIYPGETARNRIKIQNASTETIRIAKGTMSCDCITATLRDTTLKPNASTLLEIEFDSKAAPEFRGSVTVSITLILSDEKSADSENVDVRVEVADPCDRPLADLAH